MWEYIALFAGSTITILQIGKLSIKNFNVKNWLIFVCAIALTIAGGVQVYDKQFSDKYSKDSGVLSSEMSAKPLYLVAGFDTIQVPNGVIDLAKWQPEVFKNTVLQVWVEHGKMMVNADVRDSLGNMIAKIERNQWKVNPNFRWDRNFDDTGLEVKNNRDEIILQIDLKKGNTISVLGSFYNGDGTATVWCKSKTNPPITFLAVMEAGGVRDLFKLYPITPLFKYPSDENRGVRNL